QYRSSTGTSPTITNLTGSVAAGGHYLVQQAAGTGGTTPLPTPDATGTAAMSGTAGVVLLVPNTTAFTTTGNLAGRTDVIDAVGYGTAATTFEGANTGVNLTNTTAATRAASGADTDHNANDFSELAPAPQNSGDVDPGPDPEPQDATIAEIQGTGFSSPYAGAANPFVRTQGVVTAAYPAGGFFGFYMQTEGTGGPVDPAARTSSDGIFVRQTFTAGDVTVQPGDFVEVAGEVTEFAGQTQVEVTDAADITTLAETPDPVTAASAAAWPSTNAQKEVLEGMLFTPEGDFTITNNFATNQFGELGLATGDTPLIQPTQVARADTPEADAVEADNAARAITLDDGSSTNFIASSSSATTCGTRPTPCLLNGNLTPPYVSNATPFRVGATGTFDDDVILTEGGSPTAPTYRFQPVQTVVGPTNDASPATFANTRTNAPDAAQIAADGEPAVTVASFNVLNYFTTLGDADDDNIGDDGCLGFYDRNDDGNSVRDGCDQRGAWDPQDLNRQQTKIVHAINTLGADVVGLMEIENSFALGEDADEATQTLVAALNADAGAGTWAANPSSSELPPAEEMDVITNAIIYKPAVVERLGEARALGDQSSGDGSDTDEPFANAREPIAQAFAPVDGSEPFLVVVNHFKSKGSAGPFPGDADDGDGQGASNESRIRQARALRDWVPTVQGDVDDVLLLGDFNSYTEEDPLHELYDAGYSDLEKVAGNDEYSYSFSGLSGSLDHVIANASALERFTGADIWNINAGESVAMEYSRFNYHATDFHQDNPFRSSDHDPVVVGLNAGDVAPAETSVTATADEIPYGTAGEVEVDVDSERPLSGTVEVRDGSRVLGTATVAEDGTATVTLPPRSLPVGTHQLTVVYSGDAANAPSTGTVTVEVVKAKPTMAIDVDPNRITTKTPVDLTVTLTAPGQTVTGWVWVHYNGEDQLRQLRNGRVEFDLGRFKKAGEYDVWVTYAGSPTAEPVARKVEIRVNKK
ncbi:MAG: ExeM/NucH family extracellular endonuclease, partial [Nocardioides sp.]